MPAQGWAGSQAAPEPLKCAACLVGGRVINAVTQAEGTLFCLEHVQEWNAARD